MKNFSMMNWTDENVRRFWDYESNFKENYFTYQVGDRIVEFFSDHLKNKKNILDFGCGSGFLIDHLIKLNIDVYGVDFSNESIDKVNEKYKKYENFRGAHTIDFMLDNQNKFDCIIATEVIEHLNDEQLSNTMGFFKKILSSDGIVILTTPNDEDLSKSMVYCPEADCVFHRWQHVRSWSSFSLENYLKEYFCEIKIITTDFTKTTTFKTSFKNTIKKKLGIYKEPKQPHLIAVISNR
jgi:2-polyprenyl-3-methyl-5-hydroxy-6-metoxy-1,4-benzoquinol methylase